MIQTTSTPTRARPPTPILVAAAREAIENRARAGLIDFSQYIDPSQKQWYRAQHLRRIAGVLERVERGELKRVIIAVPPRHWKSSLASVKFAAWYLGRHNDHSVIIASYALSLAEKYSKGIRETIQGNGRYKQLYPDVRIRRDSNSASDWLLDTGYQTTLRAVGTGGGIAGYGFRLALLDDVSDPNKQSSQTETEGDWEWYKNVIRTRAEPDAAIVVINNRVGVNDLVGYLLDPERNDSADPPQDWEYVEIPALDEATGEYLWVERFGTEFYQKLQNDPHLWRIQYQQKPTLSEGALIKRERAQYVPTLPEGVRVQVRANDLALTIKETQKHDPDFTAEVSAVKHNDFLYMVDPKLYRAEIPQITTNLMAYKLQHPYVRMGMGSALHERAVAQNLIAAGFPIEAYIERGDIVERLAAFINLWDAGRVILVGTVKEWEPFLNQWCSIPQGHDDAGAVAAGVTIMLNYHFTTSVFPTPRAQTQREQIQSMRGASNPNEGRYMGEYAPKG